MHRDSFGPLSFWFLNHQLERAELLHQIDELKEKGFSGFFIHPRAGLLTPYASKEWYDVVGWCITYAREQGMEAWLYDEDPYPSGAAGGQVLFRHPEFRATFLSCHSMICHGPGSYQLDMARGDLVGAFLLTKNHIRRVDEFAGIVRTKWKYHYCASSYYPPYSAEGSAHWRADTSEPHYRLSLQVDDEGPSTLIGFTRVSSTQGPWGEYPDLLNPKAVECFVDLTHRKYEALFSAEFGRTIPGIFTDEAKVLGHLPWSPGLLPVFHSLTGLNLPDVLPHLVTDLDDRSEFLRWAYRETVARVFKASFGDTISNYCKGANILWTGHVGPEENPVVQSVQSPGIFRLIGAMDIPGTDLIGSDIGDAQHPLLHLSPKIASSAAHTHGKNQVICEAFAVVDWVQEPGFLGKATNWLYALGVNTLTTHGQFYSIDGLRKREAAPSQFFQASYWEHFSAFSSYVTRLSEELSEGRHEAPLLLYYPEEAFMALSQPQSADSSEENTKLREELGLIVHLLLIKGYDFDLVDAETLLKVRIQDGKMRLADESYSAIVLPGGRLRADSAAALKALETGGGGVVSLQEEISILGEKERARFQKTANRASIVEVLSSFCRPLFKAEGDLICHQRNTSHGRKIFLVNNGSRSFSGPVELDFEGPYEFLDLQSGVVHTAPLPLHIELEPGRGTIIRQKRISLPHHSPRSLPRWQPLMDISCGWSAKACSDNCLILSKFSVHPFQDGKAGIEAYNMHELLSGHRVDLLAPEIVHAWRSLARQTYFTASVECAGEMAPIYLVRDSQLGAPADSSVSESFRFFVNHKEVRPFESYRRYDPFNLQTDLEGYLHPGRNFITFSQTLPVDWPLEKGMPYDAVRLFGDFHVEFPFGSGSPASLHPRPKTYAVNTGQSPGQLGHPHYGGIFSYTRNCHLKEVPSRLALRMDQLFETAEIRVNGIAAGILWQPPYLIELDPSLWKGGHNVIEIRCSTSPSNYLQGLNRPAGFLGGVELLEA